MAKLTVLMAVAQGTSEGWARRALPGLVDEVYHAERGQYWPHPPSSMKVDRLVVCGTGPTADPDMAEGAVFAPKRNETLAALAKRLDLGGIGRMPICYWLFYCN